MSTYTVAQNQQDVSVTVLVLDEANGVPYTGMTAATAGHVIWYQRGHDNAEVTDGGSAADHAAIGDAHTDWEFIHKGNGRYRVDFPDAAFADGVGTVEVGMSATGYSSVSAWSYRGEKQRRRVSEPPLAGADPAAQERLDYGNGALTDDCAYAW